MSGGQILTPEANVDEGGGKLAPKSFARDGERWNLGCDTTLARASAR